jgi:N-acetyl-D-muramate 6-phosphate phosphatase
MKTAILFDLDGTVLDTAPDFFKAITHLRDEHGFLPLNESETDLLRLAVSNGVNEILLTGLSEVTVDPSLRHPLHDRYLELYQSVIAKHTVYFPGIEHLLQTLEDSSIPWGIVTNKPHRQTQSLLTTLNLISRAKVIVSGDTTPFAKPHPAPLLHAAGILNIDPKYCLYIGDAERDIIAGKAAGMTTMAALFGYVGDHEKAKVEWQADHYVMSAHDILPWIQSYWLPQLNEK